MEKLTFDLFKQYVVENIKDFLPESFENFKVSVHEVIKNNDTKLSGLTIRPEETGIAPTLYLEDFFKEYESGKSLDYVLDHIAEIYAKASENGIGAETKEIVDQLVDYEAVKEKILPRLVNREFNEERLKTIPYTEYDSDLAVTYHVDLGDSEDGQMSVQVSNEMLAKYGVSIEELHATAIENMKKTTPATFKSMAETLAGIMIPCFEDMTEEEKEEAISQLDMPDPGMYVLCNDRKSFGAAAVLDTETMEDILDKCGEYFILPSSIHEVLIVPKKHDMELSSLEAMVQEVNATQVAPNEVLSDHVYEYDKEAKSLIRADKKLAETA